MSANKNLSKLALKVNTSGEVTDAGLESTYVSNAFFQDSTNPNLVSNGYFESVYTAADVLTKIKTVDGAGSGLDADTLDGANSTFFTNASNINTGTLGTGRLSGTYPISISGSADRLDGLQGTDLTSNNYVQGRFSSNNYVQGQLSTKLNSSSYTAADVLTKIKTVDGSGSGLDADTLDGLNSTSLSSNNYVQTQLGTKLNSSSYTASDVLTKIKTVDGSGSGLDADLLDGLQATSLASNNYVQGRFSSNGYMQSYVSTEVANLVDSAPSTLDTLNELAAALGDDANFSTTVTTAIGLRATNTYVNSTFTSNNYVKATFTSNNYFQDSVMPVGAGSDKVFYENDQTVTTNYTITTGKNAMSAGPITLDPGVTVTIPSGSEWSIT